MFCSNCGEKVGENDKFCPNCGQKVDYSRRNNSSNVTNNGDAWNSNSNKKNISSTLSEEVINKENFNKIIDGFSGIFNKWKESGSGTKCFSLLVCCCIGIYILGGIGSLITPDENTANYEDSYSFNDTAVDSVTVDENDTVENTNGKSDSTSLNDDSSSDVKMASLTDDSSSYSSSSSGSSSSSSSDDDYGSGSYGSYIGNKNSGKFHSSGCGDVNKMKDSNKVYFSSRDEAINRGYSPCGHCNP